MIHIVMKVFFDYHYKKFGLIDIVKLTINKYLEFPKYSLNRTINSNNIADS